MSFQTMRMHGHFSAIAFALGSTVLFGDNVFYGGFEHTLNNLSCIIPVSMNQWNSKKKFILGVVAVYVLTVIVAVTWLFIAAKNAPRQATDPFQTGFTAFEGLTSAPTTSVQTLVPPHAPFLGSATAKITIVEFADFECPYCAASVYPIRQVLAAYPNDVRLVFRHFPIASAHPLAETLANASLCAHDQGYFWPLHDRLYQEQESLSYERLLSLARSVGIDVNRMETCMNSGQFADALRQDFTDAVALGSRGTPTWMVNGQKIEGALPFEAWQRIIDSLL